MAASIKKIHEHKEEYIKLVEKGVIPEPLVKFLKSEGIIGEAAP